MTTTFLNKNMCNGEAGIRFIIGAIPISIIMLDSEPAAWIALLAVYPVVTAIMAWDPVYAIVNSLIQTIKSSSQKHPSFSPAG